jgi:hypothetical protein
MNCGNEMLSLYTINYCPNCGQPIKKENRIAKHTIDGKPVNQSKDQESISTKTTDSTSKVSDSGTPKAKEIARPLNYNIKFTTKPSSSGKGKAIGILIVIIIIVAVIAAVWFYQKNLQIDKLLKLGCTPEAWSSSGRVTGWSCPAGRNIDVNDPKTFMDQKSQGSYSQSQEEGSPRAYEEENHRRKELGYRQTPDYVISQLMFRDKCTPLERNSFDQTILWNCPNGTVSTP